MWAQDSAAPPARVTPAVTPQGAVGTKDAVVEAAAFDIEVRAPDDVREMLETHMELQRYRAVTDIDEAELARLITLAERDVRNLVGTLGYFNPQVDIHREERPTRTVIIVDVKPGTATVVRGVELRFSGAIATETGKEEAGAIAQREDIRRLWQLPQGRRFTQDGWDSAKSSALRQLTVKRYPAGRISSSLADIDADTGSARLDVTMESGPLFRLGETKVTGMERYDPLIVPRLARIVPGEIYDQARLNDAQQRLTTSGYFDSAYIFIDPDADPNAAPVQVQVREAPMKKVVFGVGITTDSGPRASIQHTHNRVPGIGWRVTNTLQAERKSPHAQTDWLAPPGADGWRWGALGRAERLDDDELLTYAQRVRIGQSKNEDAIDRNIYLQYDRAHVMPSPTARAVVADSDLGDGSAITANYVWTGRYFDSLPFPSRGYGLGLELGVGTTLGNEKKPFTRVLGSWLGVLPMGERRGRLAMRAQAGAVIAADSAQLPSTQLFRTGGDSTVRGYSYRSIGIEAASGIVRPGRYMSVGSIEWQRPIYSGDLPTEWEHTIFMDAGAVADSIGSLRPKVGIGTGARWRSPVGPLQVDIAYGVETKKLRLHMSVGFVF